MVDWTSCEKAYQFCIKIPRANVHSAASDECSVCIIIYMYVLCNNKEYNYATQHFLGQGFEGVEEEGEGGGEYWNHLNKQSTRGIQIAGREGEFTDDEHINTFRCPVHKVWRNQIL